MIYHPEDPKAKTISYESFFLGSDLYVAPVVDPGWTRVEVYFPGQNQTYTHVWSGRIYRGGQTSHISAPYGKPAVFIVGQPKHNDLNGFLKFVRQENRTTIHV